MLTYQEYYNMSPIEFAKGDEVAVKVVLVIGYANDYAVYVGTTDQTDNEVARKGDKLISSMGEPVANGLFRSAIMGKRYRG